MDNQGKKAIVIFVPVPQLKAYQKIHTRLVRELEKKFSGKHVLLIGQVSFSFCVGFLFSCLNLSKEAEVNSRFASISSSASHFAEANKEDKEEEQAEEAQKVTWKKMFFCMSLVMLD